MKLNPTVYVVDDDEAVRDSLSWLIESINLKVEIFAAAKDFLEAYELSNSGCLVLDVRMPGMSGLDLQENLITYGITLPVIIITGHADVSMAIRAMKAGAFDFVEKPFNDQTLLERIQAAIKQDAESRRRSARWSETETRIATLTKRENEVMDWVVSGKSNKQIALDLGLSTKTVEAHRANVMEKMAADTLPNLVEMVVRWRESKGAP